MFLGSASRFGGGDDDGEEAKRTAGEIIEMDADASGENRFGWTIREPRGVIVAIPPFITIGFGPCLHFLACHGVVSGIFASACLSKYVNRKS